MTPSAYDPQDRPENTTQNPTSTRQASPGPAQDRPLTYLQNTQNTPGVPQQPAQSAPGGYPQQPAQSVPGGYPQNTQGVPGGYPQQSAQNAPGGYPQQPAQSAPGGYPQQPAQNAPGGYPQQPAQSAPGGYPQNTQGVPGGSFYPHNQAPVGYPRLTPPPRPEPKVFEVKASEIVALMLAIVAVCSLFGQYIYVNLLGLVLGTVSTVIILLRRTKLSSLSVAALIIGIGAAGLSLIFFLNYLVSINLYT